MSHIIRCHSSIVSTAHLLLNLVVLLSGNVQDIDGSAAEEQDVVGEGRNLASELDSGDENKSTSCSGLR